MWWEYESQSHTFHVRGVVSRPGVQVDDGESEVGHVKEKPTISKRGRKGRTGREYGEWKRKGTRQPTWEGVRSSKSSSE